MKAVPYIVSAIVIGLLLGGIGITIAHAVKADSANDTIQAKHHQELVAFRKAWMDDCLQHAPPFQCVYMWSGVKPEEFVP